MLIFDVGLCQLDWIPIRENAETDKTSKFCLSSVFTQFSMLKDLTWTSNHQLLVTSYNKPLTVINFPFGIYGQGALALVKEHVRREKYQDAIKVLYSINWNISPATAYSALTTIIGWVFIQFHSYYILSVTFTVTLTDTRNIVIKN